MSLAPENIVVVGSSGAIGSAFSQHLSVKYPNATMSLFSRQGSFPIVYNEDSIAKAADHAARNGSLDLVIVANGVLHHQGMMPEKSLKDLSAEKFQQIFAINTIIPALIAKHFLPKLRKDKPVIFAAMSARIGSISDNMLGGWYAYRASKAALNMIIKNAAIEVGRSNSQAIIVGLHPGTVNSNLSKPFQRNVPEGKLFSPEYSTQQLLAVLESLTPAQSGKCFAWDGKEIKP